MRFRPLLSLAVALLTATPAAAQDRDVLRNLDPEQAAALLSNPAVQDGLAALIGQFTDAFLQTRVGPMATLTDPRDEVRSDDTLRDILRRDDPYFDARLRDHTRRSLATAGAAARGAADLNRELRATAERLQRVIDQAGGY